MSAIKKPKFTFAVLLTLTILMGGTFPLLQQSEKIRGAVKSAAAVIQADQTPVITMHVQPGRKQKIGGDGYLMFSVTPDGRFYHPQHSGTIPLKEVEQLRKELSKADVGVPDETAQMYVVRWRDEKGKSHEKRFENFRALGCRKVMQFITRWITYYDDKNEYRSGLVHRLIVKRDVYTVDAQGKVTPAAIDFAIEIHNTAKIPLGFRTGGPEIALTVTVKGPGRTFVLLGDPPTPKQGRYNGSKAGRYESLKTEGFKNGKEAGFKSSKQGGSKNSIPRGFKQGRLKKPKSAPSKIYYPGEHYQLAPGEKKTLSLQQLLDPGSPFKGGLGAKIPTPQWPDGIPPGDYELFVEYRLPSQFPGTFNVGRSFRLGPAKLKVVSK